MPVRVAIGPFAAAENSLPEGPFGRVPPLHVPAVHLELAVEKRQLWSTVVALLDVR